MTLNRDIVLTLLDGARNRARTLGHNLSSFRAYKSNDNKHTAYCHACGKLAIVYERQSDAPGGDQVSGDAVAYECKGDRHA